ncbi:MAG: FAD-dependent oxidoreductase [Anaerolineaceae bacterium]|nr:FAD-dependent oxidoreductase [Anaerolineaceae bacterium]
MTPGTAENPLRVAIIGSGPSGFYAAERLQREKGLHAAIDMFERLPTPYGLVRGGVAPDHQKIKSVTRVYDRIATKDGFRFFGNITYGDDIHLADLQAHYHAAIFAVGAQTDRELGIPGEDLPGSHAATEFVAWYNAHPDYRDRSFDLSTTDVAVIGLGNVAMDVVRILARTTAELQETDIADYALDALAASQVRNVYVLGRRGPAQSAFTNPEIRELGEMADAEVIVAPEEVELDPHSRAYVESGESRTATRNVEILTNYSLEGAQGKSCRIIMRFLTSPVEILGNGRVEAMRLVRNELQLRDNGYLSARPTDIYETIPVGLVFRSVGYRGVPLPDIPFYEPWGIIPNEKGRVLREQDGSDSLTGLYVVGWIKRGPSGVIGTNKPDSVETVTMLLEDLAAGELWQPTAPAPAAVDDLMAERGLRPVTFADWQILDELEQERGEALGRPRLKYSRVEEMLAALDR